MEAGLADLSRLLFGRCSVPSSARHLVSWVWILLIFLSLSTHVHPTASSFEILGNSSLVSYGRWNLGLTLCVLNFWLHSFVSQQLVESPLLWNGKMTNTLPMWIIEAIRIYRNSDRTAFRQSVEAGRPGFGRYEPCSALVCSHFCEMQIHLHFVIYVNSCKLQVPDVILIK